MFALYFERRMSDNRRKLPQLRLDFLLKFNPADYDTPPSDRLGLAL